MESQWIIMKLGCIKTCGMQQNSTERELIALYAMHVVEEKKV